MGEHDRINRGGRDRKLLPVPEAQLFQALKEATIDENAAPVMFEEVLGPCHRPRCAEKRQLCHGETIAGLSPAILSVMGSVFRFWAALGVCAATLATTAAAQSPARVLSIDVIYDPERRVDFSGAPPTNLQWIDDATYLQSRRTGGGIEWLKVDAASGSTSSLFDLARMEAALARLPNITPERASGLARSGDLTFNPSRTGTLVTIADDLYFYDFASAAATRLTDTAGSEEEAGFSPDGRLVAFVRGNNLHVVDVSARQERALTTDGGPQLLNGKLDWLYQEEIYGRGRFRGYWWSPDSSRLAFLQLDERPVPEYTVVDDIPYRPNVEVTDYPKAGDANPLVRLGIAHVTGSSPVWVEQGSHVATDMLIVDVDWAPGSSGVDLSGAEP